LRHAIEIDTVSSGQAPVDFIEFTPPPSEQSNLSVTQTSSSASSASIATPQVPPKKRIRRTKEQISQGITLESKV